MNHLLLWSSNSLSNACLLSTIGIIPTTLAFWRDDRLQIQLLVSIEPSANLFTRNRQPCPTSRAEIHSKNKQTEPSPGAQPPQCESLHLRDVLVTLRRQRQCRNGASGQDSDTNTSIPRKGSINSTSSIAVSAESIASRSQTLSKPRYDKKEFPPTKSVLHILANIAVPGVREQSPTKRKAYGQQLKIEEVRSCGW